MNDQEPIVITKFRGMYQNGVNQDIPPGYGSDISDVIIDRNSFRTRAGFGLVYTMPRTILRVHNYQRTDSAASPRYMVLTTDGATGCELYDTGFSLVTPIFTNALNTDFSMISLYNRVYFSCHNRIRGANNNADVRVWDPAIMTVARRAAGIAPITAPTAATGAAGNVAGGKHLISVAYETNTGFITKPGPSVQYTAPGNAQINLTAIPVAGAPAGVVKRHILVSPVILSYDGNPQHYEHFFVATINDNTTTILTINFIDSALIQSADYLYDQLAQIPAAIGFCTFQGCLIAYGEGSNPTTGNVDFGYLMRISKSGQVESFAATDGFVQVDPGDGGGVKAATEFRGLLLAFKSNRMYNVQPNDGPPNTWLAVQVDGGVGCECFGLAQVNDDQGAFTNDTLFINARNGIWMFTGTFPELPLTWNIKDFFESFDFSVFNSYQLFVDSQNKLIYLNFKILGEYRVLVGNYEDGLSYDQIKWYYWKSSTTNFNFNTIWLDVDSQLLPILYSGGGGLTGLFIVKYDETLTADYNNGTIAPRYQFTPVELQSYGLSTFTHVGVRFARRATQLRLSLLTDPNTNPVTQAQVLTTSTDRLDFRMKFNFTAQDARLLVEAESPGTDKPGKYFHISRITIEGHQVHMEYPG